MVSYSVPKYLETYIHRSGRTARAGELGLAVTLIHERHVKKFLHMLQEANKNNLEKVNCMILLTKL